jgi:hypothetical protein
MGDQYGMEFFQKIILWIFWRHHYDIVITYL